MLVDVRDDAIRVEASFASHTFHTDTEELDVAGIANLIAFGVAAILSKFGHFQKAASLFEKALTAAHFNPSSVELAGQLLAGGDQYEVVANIGEYWLATASKSRHLGPSLLLIDAFSAHAKGGSLPQLRKIAKLVQHLGERVRALDDETSLANTAFVTAARIYFGIGDWQAADEIFRRVATLEPNRTDILKEVAGAAHHAGDYARAVELYAAAIELEPDNERLRLRRADSLMMQGQLRDAEAVFDAYFQTEPVSFETIWYLKASAARFLVSSGLPDGERDTAAAVAALAAVPARETAEEADARFLAAARLDPLSFEVWTAVGEFQLARGDVRRAAGPLSIAALMDRTPQSWAKAIASAVRADLDDLARYSTGQALFDHGDELHIALRAYVSGDQDARRLVQYLEDRDIAERRPRKEDRLKERAAD
jgi:tetratricopeptide (TPR) repeat protein